ncbi:MAG: transporter associated domain-containing protein, partial [Acidobacteriaceae bacterium]
VVYAKDMARLMHSRAILQATPPANAIHGGESEMQVGQLMHDVFFVPETKAVSDLLTEFQTRRRHLAIVVDEFGSITGLVTVEDALEQIVGEMEDEFDVRDSSMQKLSSGTLVLHGNVTLLDLETQLGWRLPHDGGVETLAGFLLVHMQKIPRVGDSFVHDGRRFTVASMEDRRITSIRVESFTPAADRQPLPNVQAQGSLFDDRETSPGTSDVLTSHADPGSPGGTSSAKENEGSGPA